MMPTTIPAGFAGLLLALAIGFLIGVERGWRGREKPAGTRVAGVRTFSLLGLLGGLIGLEIEGPLRYLAMLLALGAIAALLLGYKAEIAQNRDVSATSTIAGVLTIGLGATATGGNMALASVGTGAMVILLASRHFLHQAIRFTSEADLQALLRLVLVVLVILPLLPNAPLGPFGALNPQRLWLVIVVTGAISFIGYGLARWLGQKRGTLVTAVVGALVSSTAVTLDTARRIRSSENGPADQAAVAIASLMMLARALLLASILAPFAAPGMIAFMGPAFGIAAAAAALLLVRTRQSAVQPVAPRLKPPGLGLAFVFAATVAALALASAWAQMRFGEHGGVLVLALGGTADIDAAIAAVGALPPGTLSPQVAAQALTAPVLFNTLFKLVLLVAVAGWRGAWPAALSLGATAAALAASLSVAFLVA